MPRGLLIFALCLPLAVLLGFMLADPMMGSNLMIVGAAISALFIPLLLKLHHRILIWCAGAMVIAFFLPGQPFIWIVVAGLSFAISIISRPLIKNKIKPVWEPIFLLSLILVFSAIIVTAFRTGGIGMRVLGSAMFGGRKYVSLLASLIG